MPAATPSWSCQLREAGAVMIGKTNLSEMANCLAEGMPRGYSSLGGQVLNPYDVRYTRAVRAAGPGPRPHSGWAP